MIKRIYTYIYGILKYVQKKILRNEKLVEMLVKSHLKQLKDVSNIKEIKEKS